MQNMGGEVFNYDSFKAQYDDPKSGLKTLVDKFDAKGVTLKTDDTVGGAEGDGGGNGDKEVEKMAKRATKNAESIEEDDDAQMQSDMLGFITSKMAGVEQQLANAPTNSPEEKENKEFALKMFKFLQSKLEQQKQKNSQ